MDICNAALATQLFVVTLNSNQIKTILFAPLFNNQQENAMLMLNEIAQEHDCWLLV